MHSPLPPLREDLLRVSSDHGHVLHGCNSRARGRGGRPRVPAHPRQHATGRARGERPARRVV